MGWAGLWNKRFGPIMSNFWGEEFFFSEKPFFFRAKNLSVLHRGREQTTVCYTVHQAQTIHPTENYISMNLLQMSCVITWA